MQSAQLHLFVFLGVGRGRHVHRRAGRRSHRRKYVIWVSILGVLPFTLLLPYANLFWTEMLTVIIGLILASAFSAIVVFAQELVPGRVGTVAGVFFGFAFGAGGRRRGACSVSSPTRRASTPSSRSARSCRRSGC